MKKKVFRERYYGSQVEKEDKVNKVAEETKEEKPKKKKVKNDDTNINTNKHD